MEVTIAGGETLGAKSAMGTITALKSDTVDLTGGPARGVHINGAGDIVGILADDTASRTYTVLAGWTYDYRFKKILSTGTDATGIVWK